MSDKMMQEAVGRKRKSVMQPITMSSETIIPHGRFSRNVLGTDPHLKPLPITQLTISAKSKQFGIFKMKTVAASSVDHDVHFKSVSHFLHPTTLSATDIMPSNPNKEKQRSTVISFSPPDQPIDQNHENELVKMGTERSSSDKTLSLENKESDILRTELLDPPCNVIRSSRWVKRLRMQSIESSDGRRVHKLFTRVLNYSRSNADVTFHGRLEQHQNGKSTLSLLKKSHSWIRRWCSSTEHEHEQERGCSSTRSEAQLYISSEGDEKQFPSIGAMALMGKAVSNFRPCEFRRKGPFIVWIT